MFTRKSILAIATFAALGTAALAPTSASAWGHGGGGGHFGGGHFGGHFGGHGGGHFGGWGHGWGHGYGWGHWNHGYGRAFAWRRWWNRPYYGVYGGSGYAANSYPVSEQTGSAPAAQSQSSGCLVKGYLKDGTVVFTDTCTHESAMGGQDEGQQGPQGQQGMQGMPRGR